MAESSIEMSSISSETMVLHDKDLMMKIFSRLPLLSVLKFKQVCKSWYKILTNPNHQHKLPQTLAGFIFKSSLPSSFYPQLPTLYTFQSQFNPTHPFLITNLNVEDCCDGLLLCRKYTSLSFPGRKFYILNPATGWFVTFSTPPLPTKTNPDYEIRIGFDRRIPKTYKILYKTSTAVAVFSNSNSPPLEIPILNGVQFDLKHVVYLRGTFYIFNFYRTILVIDSDKDALFPAKVIQQPQERSDECHCWGSNDDGQLIVGYQDECNDFLFRVYVFQENTGFWSLERAVRTVDVCFQLRVKEVKWLGFDPDLNIVYLVAGGSVVACNLDSLKLKEVIRPVGVHRFGRNRKGVVMPSAYKPLLVDDIL